jgi:dihydrodipicolinate reductase
MRKESKSLGEALTYMINNDDNISDWAHINREEQVNYSNNNNVVVGRGRASQQPSEEEEEAEHDELVDFSESEESSRGSNDVDTGLLQDFLLRN